MADRLSTGARVRGVPRASPKMDAGAWACEPGKESSTLVGVLYARIFLGASGWGHLPNVGRIGFLRGSWRHAPARERRPATMTPVGGEAGAILKILGRFLWAS